jgi:hypothetical protein
MHVDDTLHGRHQRAQLRPVGCDEEDLGALDAGLREVPLKSDVLPVGRPGRLDIRAQADGLVVGQVEISKPVGAIV